MQLSVTECVHGMIENDLRMTHEFQWKQEHLTICTKESHDE